MEHRRAPNIVLIVLDTVRRDHLSAYGYARRTSPNLDAFARECVVFDGARSVASWTLPAHASMFTGLLPGEHGITWSYFNENSQRTVLDLIKGLRSLPDPELVLARRLKESGYHTVGFSGNPWLTRYCGFAEGFDSFYETFRLHSVPEGFPEAEQPIHAGEGGRVLAQFITHVFKHGLQQPFFVFFNIADPHFIYLPPEEYIGRFGGSSPMLGDLFAGVPLWKMESALIGGALRVPTEHLSPFYDAELLYTDAVLGEILDRLRRLGCYDETLIIVTSDHGEHLGERGRYSHQLSVDDELIRVPLMIKHPHGSGAGTIDTNPLVSNLDVYRTIEAAAGLHPIPRSAVCPPQDLGRMDLFRREMLLSEDYYAEAYLRQIVEASPTFDPSAHRVVRRVLRLPHWMFSFEDTALVSAKSMGAAGPAPEDVVRSVTRFIEDYALRVTRRCPVSEPSIPLDEDARKRLRSLGYVSGD